MSASAAAAAATAVGDKRKHDRKQADESEHCKTKRRDIQPTSPTTIEAPAPPTANANTDVIAVALDDNNAIDELAHTELTTMTLRKRTAHFQGLINRIASPVVGDNGLANLDKFLAQNYTVDCASSQETVWMVTWSSLACLNTTQLPAGYPARLLNYILRNGGTLTYARTLRNHRRIFALNLFKGNRSDFIESLLNTPPMEGVWENVINRLLEQYIPHSANDANDECDRRLTVLMERLDPATVCQVVIDIPFQVRRMFKYRALRSVTALFSRVDCLHAMTPIDLTEVLAMQGDTRSTIEHHYPGMLANYDAIGTQCEDAAVAGMTHYLECLVAMIGSSAMSITPILCPVIASYLITEPRGWLFASATPVTFVPDATSASLVHEPIV